MTPNFKLIPLREISPDPNQPRKFYELVAMQELAASVKEKGVLQAIVVRPNNAPGAATPYMLVFGERRYRASLDAGITDIPAVIREMTDEEALEAQVIENLQRKDVHPMEEANTFKAMLDNPNRKYTVEEIAAKVGKTPYFVRQRLTFTSLNDGWQQIFYSGKMRTNDAFRIAQLSADDQDRLFKNQVPKLQESLKDQHFFVDINDYAINNLRRKLESAPFDTADANLYPKMGACTSCKFNTAVASLFPDDATNPICNNASCYQEKSDKGFKARLAEVVQDPTIVLIRTNGWMDEKETKALSKMCQGHRVHKNYEGFEINHHSTKADQDSGKVLKAFVVAGNSKGQYVWVEKRRDNNGAKKPVVKVADKIKDGKAKAEDIDAEIARIQDRERRSKQLDVEKITPLINDAYKKHVIDPMRTDAWQKVENQMLRFFVLDKLSLDGYSPDTKLKKALGISGKLWDAAGTITDDKFALAFRYLVRKEYGAMISRHPMFRAFAEALIPAHVASIAQEHAEAIAKRVSRVNGRIQKLKDIKAELKPAAPKKQGPKKPSAKKGTEVSA